MIEVTIKFRYKPESEHYQVEGETEREYTEQEMMEIDRRSHEDDSFEIESFQIRELVDVHEAFEVTFEIVPDA